jgi:hypothetical protein
VETLQALLGLGILALPVIFLFLFAAACLALRLYGAVLGFRKAWYFGLMALVVPFFGEIIALAKLLFKKDLLK